MLLALHCKAWCGMTQRGVATLGSTMACLLCQSMLCANLKAAACNMTTLQGQCLGHLNPAWQNASHQLPPQSQIAALQGHSKPWPV